MGYKLVRWEHFCITSKNNVFTSLSTSFCERCVFWSRASSSLVLHLLRQTSSPGISSSLFLEMRTSLQTLILTTNTFTNINIHSTRTTPTTLPIHCHLLLSVCLREISETAWIITSTASTAEATDESFSLCMFQADAWQITSFHLLNKYLECAIMWSVSSYVYLKKV